MMSFAVGLSCPTGVLASPISAEPLEDSTDYEYLAMQGCRILADAGCAFQVGGFGRPDWGCDVSYDMSSLVEQLPDLFDGLRSSGAGELDFYPQGVERTVAFKRVGDRYELRCTSRTSWTPSPDVEFVDAVLLDSMLTKLAYDFASALERASSEIAGLEPFRSWRRG